jgi:hypothetical protein
MCGEQEFGRVSVNDEAAINSVVERMICAVDDDAYDTFRTMLHDMCNRLGCPGFFEYIVLGCVEPFETGECIRRPCRTCNRSEGPIKAYTCLRKL